MNILKFAIGNSTAGRWPVVYYIGLMTLLLVIGCGTSSPYYRYAERHGAESVAGLPAGDPQFTLFLIGDSGSPAAEPLEPNLQILRHHLAAAGPASALVFLGDNIYSYGMPPPDHPGRSLAEQRINTQLSILKGYRGRTFFVPGNHDWNDDNPGGLAAIRRQQQYIEERMGDNVFVPGGGCPGPVAVTLDSSNVLVMLDTEWWLYPHRKPGPGQCSPGTPREVVHALDSLVTRYGKRNMFVAGHHPFYSNGTHGGYFPYTDHLFPLLDYSPVLYLPLPVMGSLNPLYRRHVGHLQDLAGKEYTRMRRSLEPVFRKHPRLLYAAGHDHSLQYHPVGGQHYVVAGSGTVESYARRGKTAYFAYSHKGFARIDLYHSKAVLSFWTPATGDRDSEAGRRVYRHVLYNIEMADEKQS